MARHDNALSDVARAFSSSRKSPRKEAVVSSAIPCVLLPAFGGPAFTAVVAVADAGVPSDFVLFWEASVCRSSTVFEDAVEDVPRPESSTASGSLPGTYP